SDTRQQIGRTFLCVGAKGSLSFQPAAQLAVKLEPVREKGSLELLDLTAGLWVVMVLGNLGPAGCRRQREEEGKPGPLHWPCAPPVLRWTVRRLPQRLTAT